MVIDWSLPQSFGPALGPPRMLESMVPFYETYIPFKCKQNKAKLHAAMEALAAR